MNSLHTYNLHMSFAYSIFLRACEQRLRSIFFQLKIFHFCVFGKTKYIIVKEAFKIPINKFGKFGLGLDSWIKSKSLILVQI